MILKHGGLRWAAPRMTAGRRFYRTMLNRIKAILKENFLCVLATCSENRPHCSLMAYIYDAKENILYMMTLRTTQKYHNIRHNPRVSVLVDTRHLLSGSENNQALTISATCSLSAAAKIRSDILRRMVERHPNLQDLAGIPDIEVLTLHPTSFLLMDGALKSHYYPLEGSEALSVNI
jgi:nitroimidazol reductase NimA-like FMN-containing flavoprotein (pyridoxamine 5'-phosphate oxidase superfamily)